MSLLLMHQCTSCHCCTAYKLFYIICTNQGSYFQIQEYKSMTASNCTEERVQPFNTTLAYLDQTQRNGTQMKLLEGNLKYNPLYMLPITIKPFQDFMQMKSHSIYKNTSHDNVRCLSLTAFSNPKIATPLNAPTRVVVW